MNMLDNKKGEDEYRSEKMTGTVFGVDISQEEEEYIFKNANGNLVSVKKSNSSDSDDDSNGQWIAEPAEVDTDDDDSDESIAEDVAEGVADALEDFVEEAIPTVEPEKPSFVDDVADTIEEGASKTKEFVSNAYDKAKDYSGIAYEKGKAFVGTVAEKGKGYASTAATFIGDAVRDLRDATKMSVARTNEKSALKRSYEDLGKLYYEVMADKAEGEFLVCCNNIKASLDKIADLTAQIEAIRSKTNVQVVDATDDTEELDEIQAVVEGKGEETEE